MEYFINFLNSDKHFYYVFSSYFIVFFLLILIFLQTSIKLRKLEKKLFCGFSVKGYSNLLHVMILFHEIYSAQFSGVVSGAQESTHTFPHQHLLHRGRGLLPPLEHPWTLWDPPRIPREGKINLKS